MAEREQAGHVVVVGTRGVALRTIEQLHAAGVEVVVVAETAPDRVADPLLEAWGIRRVSGRPRDALREAGIERAAAVVCVPDDDLHAMETALLVRRLRPDVRLVVRMRNEAVGRALAEVTGEGSVLDVASLAAPSVVEACLGSRPHPVELAGREFVVASRGVSRPGTLRELFGELAPIDVAGPEPVVCPGRDHAVAAGDTVTLVGTADQFVAAGAGDVVDRLRPDGPMPQVGARAVRDTDGGRAGARALLASSFTESERPLRITLAVLALVFLVSVTVLRFGYVKPDGSRMSLVDAVYFTVETIGTVGYGDFSFADQATWLRVYAIGLMVVGVVLAAIWFALLTQLLVSRRIGRSFGERRAATMRGHVIVVGGGAVGVRVVEGLVAAGRRVVVVDRDESVRHLGRLRALGVPLVAGDATEPSVLAAANLPAASAVAVLTSDDLVNVETGLAVRDQLGERWHDVPVVLRLFDRELAESVEDGFGFRHVRSTAALAAPWFVGAALGLDVLGTFYADRTPFMVGRLAVAAGGGLDGLAMRELSARTRVVAIHRASDGTLEHPPRRGTRFGAGDDAYLVGPYEELLAVLRRDALAPRAAGQRESASWGSEIP